jgi:hypothetical protein
MVDEDAAADGRAGVDLDAGQQAPDMRDEAARPVAGRGASTTRPSRA